jgi:hypothetical protein
MPVVRKLGHVNLEWQSNDKIMYTKAELSRLHRGFFHPSNKHLIDLIKRANMKDLELKEN